MRYQERWFADWVRSGDPVLCALCACPPTPGWSPAASQRQGRAGTLHMLENEQLWSEDGENGSLFTDRAGEESVAWLENHSLPQAGLKDQPLATAEAYSLAWCWRLAPGPALSLLAPGPPTHPGRGWDWDRSWHSRS